MDNLETELFELEGGLTAAFLQGVTGAEDLTKVSTLELSVNSDEACLFDLGQLVPHLHELRLINSMLPRIRDLGTGLMHLQVLWVPRCGLQEVDGVSSLPRLRELYAAFNDIEDLAPLADLEQLEILDLEANKVSDLDSVAFLGMCPALQAVTLAGNPVTRQEEYRDKLREYLPRLTMLDERPFSPGEAAAEIGEEHKASEPASHGRQTTSSQDELRELVLVTDGIKYARVAAPQDPGFRRSTFEDRAASAPSTSGRPTSAAPHLRHSYSAGFPRPWIPGSVARPMSALGSRPSTATGTRPGTAPGTRPGTAQQRPGGATFGQRLVEEESSSDHASDLTFGTDQVFCGNPVQALRRRKAGGGQAPGSVSASPGDRSGDAAPSIPVPVASGSGDGEEEHRDLLQELAAFKATSLDEAAEVLEEQGSSLALRGERKDELAADILIIDTDAQSRSKPSGSRTKKQPISNGEGSKADRRARPRNPASQQDDSIISLQQGQQNTRKKSEVVLRADTGGAAIAAGAAAKTKLAAYKSLSKAARSPKAISGDRLRSRDRLPAQACLVES